MPIYPDVKLPSITQKFPPLIYENHMTDIFIPNTKTTQRLPLFTINQPLTSIDTINNLVRTPAPSDGIFTEFQLFIVSNNTGDSFEIALSHGIFQSLFIENIIGTANTLYTTPTSINVSKGEDLNYIVTSQTGTPTTGKLVSAWLTFVFKPTAP